MKDLILLFRTLVRRGTVIAYFWMLIQRHRALIAYVALALAVTAAIHDERTFQGESREQLRQATRHAVVLGCERDNNSNATLRDRVRDNYAEIEKLVQEGTLNEVQAERANKSTTETINSLADRPCQLIGDQFVTDAIGDRRFVRLHPPQEFVVPEPPDDSGS